MKSTSLVTAGCLVALLMGSSHTQTEFSDADHIKFLYSVVFLLVAKQFYDYCYGKIIFKNEIKEEVLEEIKNEVFTSWSDTIRAIIEESYNFDVMIIEKTQNYVNTQIQGFLTDCGSSLRGLSEKIESVSKDTGEEINFFYNQLQNYSQILDKNNDKVNQCYQLVKNLNERKDNPNRDGNALLARLEFDK